MHVAMRIGLGIRVGMGCEQDAEFHVALLLGVTGIIPSFQGMSQGEFG